MMFVKRQGVYPWDDAPDKGKAPVLNPRSGGGMVVSTAAHRGAQHNRNTAAVALPLNAMIAGDQALAHQGTSSSVYKGEAYNTAPQHKAPWWGETHSHILRVRHEVAGLRTTPGA